MSGISMPAMPEIAEVPVCNPEENTGRWLKEELAGVTPDLYATEWAAHFLAVHGTSTERALKTLASGKIRSYAALLKEDSDVPDEALLHAGTDELDIQLDLHKYVFFNVGRVHPIEFNEVYFCFPNKLLLKGQSLVALREIANFGAIVSRPGLWQFLKEHPEKRVADVAAINIEAAQMFFRNVFPGSEFVKEIFPRFLQKHYSGHVGFKYTSKIEYPGTKIKIITERDTGDQKYLRIENSWPGPQLTVPDHVDLVEHEPALLVTTTDPGKVQAILESGYPQERIFLINDVISAYLQWSKGQIGDYQQQAVAHRYINLALRDMALIGTYNKDGESRPDLMVGFKERAST